MENGIRFDLEYETMPWHRVDAVVFDIGNILIRYAPNDFLKQLFPGDEQKQRDMMARVYRAHSGKILTAARWNMPTRRRSLWSVSAANTRITCARLPDGSS